MTHQLITEKLRFRHLEIQKNDHVPLNPEEIRVGIEKFAFTANNITYALVGNMIGYWSFFPASKDVWGTIPVWGYGHISEGALQGRRIYGFLPMAESVTMRPGRITDKGFIDVAPHRLSLPPVYNYYRFVEADSGHGPRNEVYEMVFRPLFTTAFLLDQMLEDNEAFGADSILITSASSKTAMALSHLLHERHKVELIGVTSAKNIAFVEKLGHYKRVMNYEDMRTGELQKSCTIVDFSGNSATLKSTFDRNINQVKRCVQVGIVQHDQYNPGLALDERASFFFAPNYVITYQNKWGAPLYHEKLENAWKRFINDLPDSLTVHTVNKLRDFNRIYESFIEGRVDPSAAYIVDLLNFRWQQ